MKAVNCEVKIGPVKRISCSPGGMSPYIIYQRILLQYFNLIAPSHRSFLYFILHFYSFIFLASSLYWCLLSPFPHYPFFHASLLIYLLIPLHLAFTYSSFLGSCISPLLPHPSCDSSSLLSLLILPLMLHNSFTSSFFLSFSSLVFLHILSYVLNLSFISYPSFHASSLCHLLSFLDSSSLLSMIVLPNMLHLFFTVSSILSWIISPVRSHPSFDASSLI